MKQKLIDFVSNLFRASGYELIPLWRLDSREFELFLRKLFQKYAVDLVIDVGANQGQYYDFIRYQVGFEGWIVSFEPDPACAEKLMLRAKNSKKWRVEPYGLGSKPGRLDLNISTNSVFNSFLAQTKSKAIQSQFGAKSMVVKRHSVEVKTLSDYGALLTELGCSHTYLKLDTQGFDLEVLRGAGSMLAQMCALQTEASVRAIYEGMPDYLETLAYLTQSGFALSQTFPVAHDPAMRLVEFDCVAVNSRYADLLV